MMPNYFVQILSMYRQLLHIQSYDIHTLQKEEKIEVAKK